MIDFPSPGLPGKSAQPRSQFKGKIMDDCVVPNAEFDEHPSMYPERPPLQWSAGRFWGPLGGFG